jgi:hypothetical protein
MDVKCVAVNERAVVDIVPTKLALLSSFPPAYTKPTARLSAASLGYTCLQAPSAMLTTNITAVPSTLGQYNYGTVPADSYNLTQVAPADTGFAGWECYNATGETLALGSGPSVLLSAGMDVKCVANYMFVGRRRAPSFL